ncbi:non-homologous end joining protein Ku [Streptomyces sp. NBC_01497]|uniref:non-homologous end joining protein Ku n=1 Tax=Streptomyces sp. NBC_01497 TaxID=2903885 RepID=UPI002E3097CA|nr:Ku protein [Streptomyces sp. NBC_01497]
MPRPIWTGAVSFGLVTIPIRISGASENRGVRFHRIHLEDGGRVRNQKRCELDDRIVTDDDIGKGYELSRDQIVPVTDEELDAIPLPTAKTVEIIAFMDRDAIDPVRLGQSFYLEAAGQAAAKPYVLLRRALERSGRVAVTKLALRGRERLAILDIREDALTLHTMHWPDEVRSPAGLAPGPVELTEDEITQAMSLIDGMTTDDLSAFHDEYRYAVEELLAAKAEGREPPKAEEGARPGTVVDLMAALEQSVTKAKESRGENAGTGADEGDGADATVHEMPRKRAATRKAPAKKAPAKKTPAGKRAAGRAPAKKGAGADSGSDGTAGSSGESGSGGATARSAPAKTSTAQRTPDEKTAAKKAPAKKTAARKTSAKSAPAKTSTAGTSTAKKAPGKTAAKKAPAKKAPAKKTSQPRRKAS